MKPVRLILANHISINVPGLLVRGSKFTFYKLKEALEQRKGRRVTLIAEDIFVGFGSLYTRIDIRTQMALRAQLASETANYVQCIESMHRAEEQGMDLFPHIITLSKGHIIAANLERPGSAKEFCTEFNEECQLKTLEAFAYAELGYSSAMHGNSSLGIEYLLKSVKLLSEVARLRDELTLQQIRRLIKESPDDLFVVTLGVNHRYFANSFGEIPVEVCIQPDFESSYKDEAIIKLLDGDADERTLLNLLAKEIEFYPIFMSLIAFSTCSNTQTYAEDLVRQARQFIDSKPT